MSKMKVTKIDDILTIKQLEEQGYIDNTIYSTLSEENKKNKQPHFWTNHRCSLCGKRKKKNYLIAYTTIEETSSLNSSLWIKFCSKKEILFAQITQNINYV